jgi:hypothetical protein
MNYRHNSVPFFSFRVRVCVLGSCECRVGSCWESHLYCTALYLLSALIWLRVVLWLDNIEEGIHLS